MSTIYLNTMQAAEYLNLSHRTLEKMRIQGNGPDYSKIGRLVRYKRADLEKWVEDCKRQSTSDS